MPIAILFLLLLSSPSDKVQHQRLFHINRSKDPSIVCYDVQTIDGKLIADDPIDIYWVHPDNYNRREELNWIERWKAYGIDITRRFGLDSMDIVMRANNIPLRITQRDGRWVAVTYVDKKVSVLTNVYIKTDESGLIPSVIYVELKGRTRTTDEDVSEIIKP